MTRGIVFKFLADSMVEIVWPTGYREIRNLGELRDVFNSVTLNDSISARSFGMLAVLFAALGLLRVGTELTRSNILKTLDEYYFVLPNEDMNNELQSGIDDAIDKVNELCRKNREDDLQEEIEKLI